MGGAAGDDECNKEPKYPFVLKIDSSPHKHGERHGNGKIGHGDYGIGQGVHGDEVGAPQQAVSMRNERGRTKQVFDNFTHFPPPSKCPTSSDHNRRGKTQSACQGRALTRAAYGQS